MVQLSDEELIDMLGRQLPDLLERRPELEPIVYNAFLKVLARKEEVAAVLAELRAFRADVTQPRALPRRASSLLRLPSTASVLRPYGR